MCNVLSVYFVAFCTSTKPSDTLLKYKEGVYFDVDSPRALENRPKIPKDASKYK